MSLKFAPTTHRYWLDGKPVKGVTTLIKGGLPSPALVYWSAKMVAEYVADNPDAVEQLRGMGRDPMVNALKGIPWEKRDKAAVKGTLIHHYSEQVANGLEVEVPPEIVEQVTGYATWLDTFNVKTLLTECSIGNRKHWYAGRFDLIADIGDTRWMLDVKTGKGVYSDAALQLDAYRNGEFYVTDDDPDTELPMPEGIERLGVIHVTEAGTVLHPMQSDGAPFRDFLHCAWITKREKLIKAYALEPVYTPDELEVEE